MPNFCPKCGAAAGAAKFCPGCGSPLAAVQQPQPAPQAVMQPLPKATGGGGLKVILIVLALIAVVGFAALIGLAYYAKTRVSARMAELKQRTGIDLPAAVRGAQESTPAGEKRDGCLLMSKDEAEKILGFTLTRSDGNLRPGASDEHCDYYADPKALEEIRSKTVEEFKTPANGKQSAEAGLAQVEALTKGMVAGVNDGSAPILQISVHRGDAKAASFGMTAASRLMGVKPEHLTGPWDEAEFGPMNSMLTLRKGNNGVTIDLRQVPKGREKGLQMAKVIAPRL
jgi:hypothetical protein